MASLQPNHLHFVLIPLMAQGHAIPVIDMAKLLAGRSVVVTILTTPLNASRFRNAIACAQSGGLEIRLVGIPFPWREAGLPERYESLDTLPSRNFLKKFYDAIDMWQEPIERFLATQERSVPPPSCIVSDKCLFWTSRTARKFKIPRIVFHGMCCFSLLSSHNIQLHSPHLRVRSDSEPFMVPGLPETVEVTRAQLPGAFVSLPDLDDVRGKMREAEAEAFGVVVNSFEELERGCAEKYSEAIGKKVWCVGPVLLSNKSVSEKFERGNKPEIEKDLCLKWLEEMKPASVIYVCLGSLCRLLPEQLIQLGLGLESSNQPFIWVVKTDEGYNSEKIKKWLESENFEERVKDRGLIIKGWAPQVMILSHPSIGGFLTHCGWNSTIEGICSGVPMLTWPLFAEQFLNEKFIIKVLKIGVSIGVEVPVRWGEEESVGVVVEKDRVEKCIRVLMGGGEESDERRRRVRELAWEARKAVGDGGSSHVNLSALIIDVLNQLTSWAEC